MPYYPAHEKSICKIYHLFFKKIGLLL